MADNSGKISEIEEIQNEGAQSVSVDGVSVSRDFAELRKRKRELQRTDNTAATKRPRISKIKLGQTF